MDWKHLLAYITGTVDQELLLRNEYLVTENRILHNQLKGQFIDTEFRASDYLTATDEAALAHAWIRRALCTLS